MCYPAFGMKTVFSRSQTWFNTRSLTQYHYFCRLGPHQFYHFQVGKLSLGIFRRTIKSKPHNLMTMSGALLPSEQCPCLWVCEWVRFLGKCGCVCASPGCALPRSWVNTFGACCFCRLFSNKAKPATRTKRKINNTKKIHRKDGESVRAAEKFIVISI